MAPSDLSLFISLLTGALVVTAVAWLVIYHSAKTAGLSFQQDLRSCFRRIGLLRLLLSYSLTPFITPVLILMYWRTHGSVSGRLGVVPDFWVFDFVVTFALATPLVVLLGWAGMAFFPFWP